MRVLTFIVGVSVYAVPLAAYILADTFGRKIGHKYLLRFIWVIFLILFIFICFKFIFPWLQRRNNSQDNLPSGPIRLRNSTSSVATHGRLGVNVCAPLKYWQYIFSLHCSTIISPLKLRNCFSINNDTIKRIGLAGLP